MRMNVISVLGFFLLAACGGVQPPAADVPEEPRAPVYRVGGYEHVLKSCDAGRAVYAYDSYNIGGIHVVENAPECR